MLLLLQSSTEKSALNIPAVGCCLTSSFTKNKNRVPYRYYGACSISFANGRLPVVLGRPAQGNSVTSKHTTTERRRARCSLTGTTQKGPKTPDPRQATPRLSVAGVGWYIVNCLPIICGAAAGEKSGWLIVVIMCGFGLVVADGSTAGCSSLINMYDHQPPPQPVRSQQPLTLIESTKHAYVDRKKTMSTPVTPDPNLLEVLPLILVGWAGAPSQAREKTTSCGWASNK